MFKELTDDLLELTARVRGVRVAFLAQTRPGAACCSCSCCCGTFDYE